MSAGKPAEYGDLIPAIHRRIARLNPAYDVRLDRCWTVNWCYDDRCRLERGSISLSPPAFRGDPWRVTVWTKTRPIRPDIFGYAGTTEIKLTDPEFLAKLRKRLRDSKVAF